MRRSMIPAFSAILALCIASSILSGAPRKRKPHRVHPAHAAGTRKVYGTHAAGIRRGHTASSAGTRRGESTAWIRSSKNGDVFVTEDAAFDFVRVLHEDGRTYTRLLIRHTSHNEWSDAQAAVRGSLAATAWTLPEKKLRQPRWFFRSAGTAVRLLPDIDMFQASNAPCCGSAFQNNYYSLLSGKKLYTTNGAADKGFFGQDAGLVRVDGSFDGNRYTRTRYIGFGADQTTGRDLPTLQYGTDLGLKQLFSLEGHDYSSALDVPKVSLTKDGATLADYIDVEGPFTCTIVLQFNDGPQIRIPVENDLVRADRAALPPGYVLREEKMP